MNNSKADRLLIKTLKALVKEITDDAPGIALAASDSTPDYGLIMAASGPTKKELRELKEEESQSLIQQIRNSGRAWKALELANVLQLDKGSIYKMAATGRLPCYRIGDAVRFDPKATADWLETKVLA